MLLLNFYFQMAWTYVASVGWYIVALIGIIWYTYPYIQDKYTKWKIKRDEAEYAAKYHKNSDLLQQRLLAVESSRQKMQEQYIKSTLIAKEKEEERKQKKKEEVRNLLDGDIVGHGRKDEASTSNGTKSKSGYNPLMGDGSRSYRPPKRSCCGKGGCG
ncbi:uncharacterized protein LOC118448442 [Vespa mandarinia]|uniref:uncharacterized protein LOC118448442 n=1 Tax=Vespa mandarinia TaxID=7446 RepID=UPI00161CB5C7|nr:uncharacterized protein LOC118448442 [Vespa mandarinia]XP_035737596.1 uncharacterized protein LOC118448442 [Vespa mandarinia]